MKAPRTSELYVRQPLERRRPERAIGSAFRTEEGKQPGVGGFPLGKAEDSVVAAVRLAYKVADAQIARSTHLAQRLRQAGDRAVGPESERKAVDATEQLVFRAIMSGLSWLETAAGAGDDPGSPVKRLLAAEYRLLGGVLGLMPASAPGARPEPQGVAAAPSRTTNMTRLHPLVSFDGDERRPVSVRRLELMPGCALLAARLTFYSEEPVGSPPLTGSIGFDQEGRPMLRIRTTAVAAPGGWKAAICQGDLQIGLVEIEL